MIKLLILLTVFVPVLHFSQNTDIDEELSLPKQSAPLYQFFHMYAEYASGELANAHKKRIFEQWDTKMTFNQNLPGAEWLSLGFVAQVTWDQVSAKKLNLPSKATLSATVGFVNNIFTIGSGTDGVVASTIFYNKALPPVKGLHSHDITFLFAPNFYAAGHSGNWFEKLEMRFAYRMKFNKYIGLRPEFLFNFTGTDLLAGKSADEAFLFRFNTRLQFHWDMFSFFIEPRFFYVGNNAFHPAINSSNGFMWEVKVGFDITHFVFKDKK